MGFNKVITCKLQVFRMFKAGAGAVWLYETAKYSDLSEYVPP